MVDLQKEKPKVTFLRCTPQTVTGERGPSQQFQEKGRAAVK